MNKSIRLVSLFAVLLTAVLLVNLTVVQAFSTDKYAHNSRNVRGYMEMRTTPRGQIFAGDTVLAQSTADAEGNYSRSYPTDSPAFSNVTGYLSERFGASQLEASQNDVLNGRDDSLLARNWLDVLSGKPQVGANVEVTIDPALQQAAYDQLAGAGYNGSAVAIQPSTGKILAMASSPSYNASDLMGDQADEKWSELQEQDGKPLINHATQETLPPGSIFKIITTAAGLNNGFTPESTLTGEASITLPDSVTELTNYGNQACGGAQSVNLQTAFALSATPRSSRCRSRSARTSCASTPTVSVWAMTTRWASTVLPAPWVSWATAPRWPSPPSASATSPCPRSRPPSWPAPLPIRASA